MFICFTTRFFDFEIDWDVLFLHENKNTHQN